ncbi:hypothetical protein H257_11986 [Aphanomyces astaci]|uniref:Uncharacterized protein n=1 Tax=Aphanomyces astaci TaxID=112090 RepID=W4G0G2_APHAT|nr:hypothetical protein H257_11986 [Aphanomyces astaci]ETV73170.1 hypothetical protein H257_11986 [Aphanomyces astaci]|eukprot:XP_009837375.1 hypothetical protein H257_11986 [Aphanomyces astaci]
MLSTSLGTTPPPNEVVLEQQLQVALPPVIVAAAPPTTTTPSQRGEVLPEPVETPVQISLAAAALLDSIIAAIEPPLVDRRTPYHTPTGLFTHIAAATVVEVMDMALCAYPTPVTNPPPVAFDPQRPSGDKFLRLLHALPPADFNCQVFVDSITMDEVEDALNAANLTSAPCLEDFLLVEQACPRGVEGQRDRALGYPRKAFTTLTPASNWRTMTWQIIKAIKMFVMSQLEFAIHQVKATKSQLQGFSLFLAKSLRHLLRLATTSTKAFIYSRHPGVALASFRSTSHAKSRPSPLHSTC